MTPCSSYGPQKAANHDATGIACQTVLSTTELVEQIIMHLPAKRVFRAQRVCKTFANVIATSPSIQKKIFKRLSTGPLKQTRIFTTSLTKGKHASRMDTSGKAKLAINKRPRRVLSPWLTIVSDVYRFGPRWRGFQKAAGVEVRLEWRRSVDGEFFTDDEDSYMDTYFCDPPCRQITVFQTYVVDGDTFENCKGVRTDRPMTIRRVAIRSSSAKPQICFSSSASKHGEVKNGSIDIPLRHMNALLLVPGHNECGRQVSE
jgi:hypothetical protein